MIFAVLFGLAILLGYYLNQHRFNYWRRRGFQQLEPKFIFGDAKSIITLKQPVGVFYQDLYNKFKKSRVVGVYVSYVPALLITDPKLVQDIMVRDFSSFTDRVLPTDEEKDPLNGNLFSTYGQRWRDLRTKLTPTFTSGKLKGMFPVIKDCSQVLDDYLVKQVNGGVNVFEFRDLMARYNTNIISSVAFGIDNDCINDPDHPFRKIGAKVFEANFENGIKQMIVLFSPKILEMLNMTSTNSAVQEFMFSVVKQTVDYREKEKFSRNDFIQLLIDLKNQGYVSVDKGRNSDEVKKAPVNSTKFDFNALVAQVFIFFVAGFETSSSTMSYCMFELARNPEVLKKVQQETDKIFQSLGPEGLTYEIMGQFKYLEACIDETLRKYPPLPIHMRRAVRDYKIADSNLIIPTGTSINIPVLGFQRDPEIYDNPLEFRPERFLNSSNGGGSSEGVFYSPFGEGPRNCIGMRMGKLTTKIGLAVMLSKFNFEVRDKEMVHEELEFNPKQLVLTPTKLINLKVTSR